MRGRIRVVLVGKSPLSFFLAKELDRYLGSLVQYELFWLTDDKKMVLDVALVLQKDPAETIDLTTAFSNLQLKAVSIRSINTKLKEITTTRGSIEYDLLLLDQLPYYSYTELSEIMKEYQKLLVSLKSAERLGKELIASIDVNGQAAVAWELALALRTHQLRSMPTLAAALSIKTDNPDLKVVRDFLKTLGIQEKKTSRQPGIKIAPPLPMVNPRQIKGIKVDISGHIVTDAVMRVKGHDSIIAFDTPEFIRSNLKRVYKTLSKQFVGLLATYIDSGALSAITLPKVNVLLKGNDQKLLVFGDLSSKTVRASLVDRFERSLRRRSR